MAVENCTVLTTRVGIFAVYTKIWPINIAAETINPIIKELTTIDAFEVCTLMCRTIQFATVFAKAMKK